MLARALKAVLTTFAIPVLLFVFLIAVVILACVLGTGLFLIWLFGTRGF
jgi:hypothetical protein